MDTFWAVRRFCTKPVSFQVRQFAAANGKRCCVFRAGLFPLQPNIADAAQTQGLAAGQTTCFFRPAQLT